MILWKDVLKAFSDSDNANELSDNYLALLKICRDYILQEIDLALEEKNISKRENIISDLYHKRYDFYEEGNPAEVDCLFPLFDYVVCELDLTRFDDEVIFDVRKEIVRAFLEKESHFL